MVSNVSINNLQQFAAEFWAAAKAQKVFLFFGEMGAGKTTIIETLCAAKGVKDRMSSPTFSIINQYSFKEDGVEKKIYHLDLYRLKTEEEMIQAGVEDAVYSGDICMVEWPQKAPDLFDENVTNVFITWIDEQTRSIKIEWPGGSMQEQL